MNVKPLYYGQVYVSQEHHPWGKAWSYSLTGHGFLIFLFLLIGMGARDIPTTVLTEINFIEVKKEVVVAPKREPVAIQKGVQKSGLSSGRLRKAVSADNKRKEPRVPISSPRGKPKGEVVAEKPLKGPIFAANRVGKTGRKKVALLELSGRTRGRAAGLKGVENTTSGQRGDKTIALAKVDLDTIKRNEGSLGAPVVSGNVVGGSLRGRSKELAAVPIGRRKKAAAEDLKANPFDADKWGKNKGPFSMEGPLKYRKILKMELPPYPRWAEEQALEAAVSIRLWVNPKGIVLDNMYLEKTSGYSELDHLAMDALRRFKFVKIPSDQPQDDEWGVATFRFELKK